MSEGIDQPDDLPVSPLTARLSQVDIHQRLVDSLGEAVKWHSELAVKPFELDLVPPLPAKVRIYAFNATRPPGGRPLGEHKIQPIMPGQKRKERGSFDHSDGRLVFLMGYAAEEDVFILWDASLYADFAWSRNVQVKATTIIEASAGKLSEQQRRMRPGTGQQVTETLLAAPASRFAEAFQRRVQLTRTRMMQD